MYFVFDQDHDFYRTVGINTDYIETLDFDLDMEDRQFLWEVRSIIDPAEDLLFYPDVTRRDSATKIPRCGYVVMWLCCLCKDLWGGCLKQFKSLRCVNLRLKLRFGVQLQ